MSDPIDIFVDGGSRGNPGPSACAFVVPKQKIQSSHFLGTQTNNVAEYCAVLMALVYAKTQPWTKIRIFSDSQLVCKQYSGEFACREKAIRDLLNRLRVNALHFESLELVLIKRKRNRAADALCNAELNRHQ